MNTEQIMRLALELAGMSVIPADSAVYCPRDNIKRILLGIDVSQEDLQRAKEMGCDLVFAHHPLDWVSYPEVFDRHRSFMLDAGVDRGKAHEIAEGIKLNYRNWIGSLGCKDAHKGMSSLAEKLALGLMNVHLPSDELGRRILQKGADELGPEGTVDQLMNRYATYPEIKAGPEEVELVCGDPNSPIGRTAVIHAAGTNGGYPVANALFEAGVRTVVYIHLFSDQEAKRLKNESRGNLIVTGHYFPIPWASTR